MQMAPDRPAALHVRPNRQNFQRDNAAAYQPEMLDARFFFGFAHRHMQQIGFAVRMAARPGPALIDFVKRHQCFRARAVHNDRGCRHVRIGAVPQQKPLSFAVNQGQYLRLLRRLAFVLRDIVSDCLLPVLRNVRVLHQHTDSHMPFVKPPRSETENSKTSGSWQRMGQSPIVSSILP